MLTGKVLRLSEDEPLVSKTPVRLLRTVSNLPKVTVTGRGNMNEEETGVCGRTYSPLSGVPVVSSRLTLLPMCLPSGVVP